MGKTSFKPPCRKRHSNRCKDAPASCKFVNKTRKYCRKSHNDRSNSRSKSNKMRKNITTVRETVSFYKIV